MESQFLVLPFAGGDDLVSVVEQGRISETFVKKTIFCVLKALRTFTVLGLFTTTLNRITSSSLIIATEDNVVLGDFGMARERHRCYCQSRFGTEVYVPPERLCKTAYDNKADICSCCCSVHLPLPNDVI